MSKAFYFILALAIAGGSLAITNPFDLPLVYAQTVTTKGNNYDLIEDFTIGEAKWTSHPERILVNGEWENYFLQADNQKIIFRSNSIGGFIYDIPSCSYSIYENGFNGNQIIPSVSAVATKNVNGQWQNMEVNNESCDVTFTRNLNGIEIFSTKTLTENFNIQTTNGTIITNSTQTEKFVQELKVDIFGGIKETFMVWNESDEPLGISQTVHTGESITIGANTLNIAELNGQSFSKQFLEDNQAQVFEIAESLNYDFKDGFDSLSNVNIFFDGDYKVNLDYASGDFVNYLEIDPTFGYVSASRAWVQDVNCTGSPDAIGNTHGYTGRNSSGSNCFRSMLYWDITSIPNDASIDSLQFRIDGVEYYSNQFTCDVMSIENNFSSLVSSSNYNTGWTDIGDGTTFISNSDICTGTAPTGTLSQRFDVSLTGTASMVSDLQNELAVDDEWGIGFKPVQNTNFYLTNFASSGTYASELEVTYSLPTYPQPPTNLQTVTGIPIEVSWTAPVDDGGSSVTGYKVYRTLNQYAMTELPNNGGTTPVDFSDNELLLHGTTTVPNQAIPITFDSSTVDQFTINGNTVTPTATSWVSKVRSIETFNPANGGGEIIITRSADDYVMVGFGKDPFAGGSTSEYDSIEFANYMLPSYLRAFESGTQVHQTASVTTSASDVFKVTMDSNGQVKYWHNGVAFYTSSKTASGDYYVHVAGNSIVSTTVNYIGDATTITDSSPNTLTVTANSGTTTTGQISNAISTPNLEVTSSLLPDGTDSFTVGSWVKQAINTPELDTDFSSATGWTSGSTSSFEVTNNELQMKAPATL